MASMYEFRNRVRGKQVHVLDTTVTIVASTTTVTVFDLPPGLYTIGFIFQSIGNTANSVTYELFPYGTSAQAAASVGSALHVMATGGTASAAIITHAANTPTISAGVVCASTVSGVVSVPPVVVPVLFGIKLVTITGAGVAAGSYTVKLMAAEV